MDPLKYKTVGRKQAGDNARWQYVWDNITRIVTIGHAEALVYRTANEVSRMTAGKNTGWAWSGGKDSQALRVVMEMCGITRCVLGMTADLEYPAFLRWVTDDMPEGLDVIETGQDMAWLVRNEKLLFPQDAKAAGKWFAHVQHRAQAEFYARYNLDIIVLGRRTADRNYVGENGIYTNAEGVTRYSPIRDWSHEEVLAVCYYYKQALAPFYFWPNGWVVGTGAWPARQWTGNTQTAWREIYEIDSTIVHRASRYLDSARQFLENDL